jgi:branched-subunit amino acid permease
MIGKEVGSSSISIILMLLILTVMGLIGTTLEKNGQTQTQTQTQKQILTEISKICMKE